MHDLATLSLNIAGFWEVMPRRYGVISQKDLSIRDAACTYHTTFGLNKGVSLVVSKIFFYAARGLILLWSAEILLDVSHAAYHCLLLSLSDFVHWGGGIFVVFSCPLIKMYTSNT